MYPYKCSIRGNRNDLVVRVLHDEHTRRKSSIRLCNALANSHLALVVAVSGSSHAGVVSERELLQPRIDDPRETAGEVHEIGGRLRSEFGGVLFLIDAA